MSVAIIVRDCQSQTLSWPRESELCSDFRKGPISFVEIHERRNRFEEVWMAVCPVSFFVFSAPDVVKVPFEIAQHDQIKESIAIQIHPCGTRRPATASHAGLLRHIGEGAITVVVIQLVPAVRSNIQVLIAVIVVIPDGYSHSLSRSLQSRFFRNVFAAAVTFLLVEPIPILRPCFLRNRSLWRRIGEWRTVDQENIQTPIVVIVK